MRRIDKDDFIETNELELRDHLEGDEWRRCTEYELEESPRYGGPSFAKARLENEYPPYKIKAKYSPREYGTWRTYRPLEDYPHLFLEFARLYDGGLSVERIMNWVSQYGTLGHNFVKPIGPTDTEHKDTIRTFWQEVCYAAGILAMYEVVLNEDAEEARRLTEDEFYFLAPHYWTRTMKAKVTGHRTHMSPLVKNTGHGAEYVAGVVEDYFNGDHLAYALDTAVGAVNEVVQEYCFPTLGLSELSKDPSRIAGGWGFKNLLGAMYLQMYWLMASGADVKRCKYCGRIMSFASPLPGARKTRSDKKHCSKRCRQNHANKVKREKEAVRDAR